MTSNDLLLTFDTVVMIDFFVRVIKPYKMQQTRTKSDVV